MKGICAHGDDCSPTAPHRLVPPPYLRPHTPQGATVLNHVTWNPLAQFTHQPTVSGPPTLVAYSEVEEDTGRRRPMVSSSTGRGRGGGARASVAVSAAGHCGSRLQLNDHRFAHTCLHGWDWCSAGRESAVVIHRHESSRQQQQGKRPAAAATAAVVPAQL